MKKKKKVIILIFSLFMFFSLTFLISKPIIEIYELPEKVSITYEGIDEINKNKNFGKFVKFEYDDSLETSSNFGEEKIKIKLFNCITLRTLTIGLNSLEVYAGGDTIGFSLNSKGVVLIGHSEIVTKDGKVDVLKDVNISNGDVILKLNGKDINKVSHINDVLDSYTKEDGIIQMEYIKNGEILKAEILPALDVHSNTYKLGIWVKDETSGIGTLTYVNKGNGAFGALGHAICDKQTNTPFEVNSGDVFPCSVLGVKKGEKGKPGEVRAIFLPKNKIGEVLKNTKFGIYGNLDLTNDFVKNKQTFSAGGRLNARPGKAKIRSDISGELKDYDIEIIKTNYQNSKSEKSMVIKVTDKELISLTGGIVQGMSGCPHIQNNKIIGAVTHVFVNDPLKGFGLYLDWMIK